MKIVECRQRSEEWFEARRGIPTTSNFDKIITSKGEPSKQRYGYLYALAAERLTGRCEEAFQSAAMLQGILREEEARRVYAMTKEVEVEEVGFCLSDDGRYGCSPDGFVDDLDGHGMVELKCRMGKAAVEHLLASKLSTECIQQVQGGMMVTGTEWCDYVSYYPGLPLLIVRVTPDRSFLEKLQLELDKFCDDLDRVCDQLRGK